MPIVPRELISSEEVQAKINPGQLSMTLPAMFAGRWGGRLPAMFAGQHSKLVLVLVHKDKGRRYLGTYVERRVLTKLDNAEAKICSY